MGLFSRGLVYSVLGDFAQAEDGAQEAPIQTYRDLPMLREPRAFPAWLRRVVYKHCDRARRRRMLPTIPLDPGTDLADLGRTPLEALLQQETHDEVLAALRALPEHERTTTTLFYIDGYSVAEVGEFLEVPVGTVRKRLHSVRKRLRERMAEVEKLIQRTFAALGYYYQHLRLQGREGFDCGPSGSSPPGLRSGSCE